jgi:hypothetical protein
MAVTLLTEEEYQFLIGLEKDLLERAKTASPRASTHLRAIAKMHTDFLALEDGKRAAGAKKSSARQERDALKLQRQQERLTALQQQMQNGKQAPASPGSQQQAAGSRRERTQQTA